MSYLITYEDPRSGSHDTEIVRYKKSQADAEQYARQHANGWIVESVTPC